MSAYLLDTDIAIELLRGRNIRVAERLASKRRQDVFLSTITIAELLFGAHRSAHPQHNLVICREFCSSFEILALDAAAAERSGALRASLEAMGQRIGAYDLLIAGIAAAHERVLVTHNKREFERIPELQLEDWAAEDSI